MHTHSVKRKVTKYLCRSTANFCLLNKESKCFFFKLAPESNAEEIIQSQSGACFGAYKTLQTTAGSIASGVDTWEACTEHCADKTECTAYYFTASNTCKFFTGLVSGSATSADKATTIYRREPCGNLIVFIAF